MSQRAPFPGAGNPVIFGAPVIVIKLELDPMGNIRLNMNRQMTAPQLISIFSKCLAGQAEWLMQQQLGLIDPNRIKTDPETKTETKETKEDPDGTGNEEKADDH